MAVDYFLVGLLKGVGLVYRLSIIDGYSHDTWGRL